MSITSRFHLVLWVFLSSTIQSTCFCNNKYTYIHVLRKEVARGELEYVRTTLSVCETNHLTSVTYFNTSSNLQSIQLLPPRPHSLAAHVCPYYGGEQCSITAWNKWIIVQRTCRDGEMNMYCARHRKSRVLQGTAGSDLASCAPILRRRSALSHVIVYVSCNFILLAGCSI